MCSSDKILDKTNFDDFDISDKTKRALKEHGFDQMTDIQIKAVPHMLKYENVVATAKTGQGKTIAFLIPAIELLYRLKIKPRNGTGAIIISPTRELATQTYGVLKQLMKYHSQTCGLIIGGESRKGQVQKLSKGINILVVTPGRLLDHLQNTPEFIHKHVSCVVLDEADLILDIGFDLEIQHILKLLPTNRMTHLFTASLTDKTKNLISVTYKIEPVYVGDHEEMGTVCGLKQYTSMVQSEHKLYVLYCFLSQYLDSAKIIVFFNSHLVVEYCYRLFNVYKVPNLCIHGKQDQKERGRNFRMFTKMKTGNLFCTDIAARGLDIPGIDWVVQFDPARDYKTYIHRVGRTARGSDSVGKSIIFLRPEERAFKNYIIKDTPFYKKKFGLTGFSQFQSELEQYLSMNWYLRELAQNAYRGTIGAYNSLTLKDAYNVDNLNRKDIAASFGLFKIPPDHVEERAKFKKRKTNQDNQQPNKKHKRF